MKIVEIGMYIFFLVLVVVGAYYTTRFIALKSTTLFKGKHMNIIDRISFERDKSFVLLKKEDKIYLVGVSSNGMTLIDSYSSCDSMESSKVKHLKGKYDSSIENSTKVMTEPSKKEGTIINIIRKMQCYTATFIKNKDNNSVKHIKVINDTKELDEMMEKMNNKKTELSNKRDDLKRGNENVKT